MKHLLLAILTALLLPNASQADNSVIGTYKLVSFVLEIDGVPGQGTIGPDPRGYLVITPRYYMYQYAAKERSYGTSTADKAALFDTAANLVGSYVSDGKQLDIQVDISWNQIWNGTRQIRSIQWEGNKLTLTSPPQPYPRDTSKTVVSRLVWEKIE